MVYDREEPWNWCFSSVKEIPLSTAVTFTMKSSSSVTEWCKVCLKVCAALLLRVHEEAGRHR